MRIAIIGAGLQGVGIALEAARLGETVDLFEKCDSCLERASSQNEGKVHLGFVYANDSSMRTARLMATAALHFEKIVAEWLELGALSIGTSSPFCYIVHPKSMLSEDELKAYWSAVTEACSHVMSSGAASYFGGDPCTPVRRRQKNGYIAFETPEIAIDPVMLATLLQARVSQEPRIRLRTATTVEGVQPSTGSVGVIFTGPEGRAQEQFDHVVNASWESLVAIDRTAGVTPIAGWSFRLKRFLRMHAPELANIDSSTMVLGPFGDVVNYGNGQVYLSWYPAGCRSMSFEDRHPDWPTVLEAEEELSIKSSIVNGLRNVLPELSCISQRSIEAAALQGGIIYALGHTGIEDRDSMLHQRSATGPRSFGRYHSVDTGKWTTAPWFARQLAAHICGSS